MPRNSAEKHSYFIKDKAGFYYITKDIYSKRGLLLIRKGQKVSPKTMSKLIRLKFQNPEILNDRYDINNPTFFPDDQPSDILNSDSRQKNIFTSSNLPEDIFTSNIQQRDTCTLNSQPEAIFTPRSRKRDILTPATKKFGEKMNIKDYYILEKPNKVLSNIIFESKSKPWWIYVNALPITLTGYIHIPLMLP